MRRIAIVGLGVTGKSVLHHFRHRTRELIACDTRSSLEEIDKLKKDYPEVEFHLSGLEPLLAHPLDQIVVSPGISLEEPVLQKLKAKGVLIQSDIDLFLQNNSTPVIAITGSNGKTTVTTWVGDCLSALGYSVFVCGNIGEPVLAIESKKFDFIVMELSSFQLEASHPIRATVAICLNVTPDHLDRHGSMENYTAVKMRIYAGASIAVVRENAGYAYTPEPEQIVHLVSPLDQFSDQSEQQRDNREAVVAILEALNIDKAEAIRRVAACQGLKHRFETVGTINGVCYINDSKATNVGAAIMAMRSAKARANCVIVIAGGQTKASPLEEWASVAKECAEKMIVYGQDADLMQHVLGDLALRVNDLKEAMVIAKKLAKPGDIVLLAPAAASLDQFKNYEERGDCFARLSNELHSKENL